MSGRSPATSPWTATSPTPRSSTTSTARRIGSGRPRGYVGDLKTNRKLEWKGRIIKANDLAASIPAADRKEMRIGDRRQWYFTVTVRIPDVKHKVRIVILWRYRNDERAAARSW